MRHTSNVKFRLNEDGRVVTFLVHDAVYRGCDAAPLIAYRGDEVEILGYDARRGVCTVLHLVSRREVEIPASNTALLSADMLYAPA